MFKNMKVSLRLALSFTIILVLMLMIIVVSLREIQTSEQKFKIIVKINNTRIKIANHITDNARETAIEVRNILFSEFSNESNEKTQQYKNNLTQVRKKYLSEMDKFKKVIPENDKKLIKLFNSMEESEAIARQLQDKVIKLALEKKPEEGRSFMFSKSYPAVKEWVKLTDNIIDYSDELSLLRYNEALESTLFAKKIMVIIGITSMLLSIILIIFLSRNITKPLTLIVKTANRIASGDLNIDLSDDEKRGDEIGLLMQALSKMILALRNNQNMITLSINERKLVEMQLQKQDWLKTGIVRLNSVMSGEGDINVLSSKVISEISTYINAQIGAIYVTQNNEHSLLSLTGSYAYTKRKNLSNEFRLGEGLVGQAALEKKPILLKNVPEDYIRVTSGLGELIPRFICVYPFIYEENVKGVVELGTLNELTDQHLEYLNQVMPVLGVGVETAASRKLAKALERAQILSEELQTQQEELQITNEELEEQTQRLKSSEEKLKIQQEELQITNEELEKKNELLGKQNIEVEKASKDIKKQADELALASKYKSEFLSNMSHELRTPLNSLLLLAQLLSENKTGNLNSQEVESAKIIYGSGNDLLKLINEILDLSKIEAGQMDLQIATVKINDLAESIISSFKHMTEEKGLKLEVVIHDDAPKEIISDYKRVEQVIRNLMSNSIKFTNSGGITIVFSTPAIGTDLSKSGISNEKCLSIEVNDTGIGISPENQKIIFDAFRQVDGGTTRKYGGTGLGLSISRDLASLLGGEIQVESELGKGSKFTLYLPVSISSELNSVHRDDNITIKGDKKTENLVQTQLQKGFSAIQIEDDRNNLNKNDRIILIIEDDPNFARILYGKCNEKNFKCLSAPTGELGLEIALKYKPVAIILDISLPVMNGWEVLRNLKENANTRHIPVHVVSGEDFSTEAIKKGAVGQLTKPLSYDDLEMVFQRLEQVLDRKPKRILVIEDDPIIRSQTIRLLEENDVFVDEAENGKQALDKLRTGTYDCVILDLGLPDIKGINLMKLMKEEGLNVSPIIVYTACDLTREEDACIHEYAESIIIKDIRSKERLLDEVALFLHQIISNMPENKRKIILNLQDTDTIFKNKKVLIVDDDMRATFALSHLLSKYNMNPLKAENGERALKLLDEHPDIDIVFMDIMMPVMDGYETMKQIRSQNRFLKLPIIALTAKAMPEDREKCLSAGANDYMWKPIDHKRLISMMRVWLSR